MSDREAEQLTLELARREDILAAHAAKRREWLRRLQGDLRACLADRVQRYPRDSQMWVVSGNDARRIFEQYEDAPGPEVSRSFLGAVFRRPGWVRAGHTLSTGVGHHACEIKTYKWGEPESPGPARA